ncbi:hypothetical protein BUE80_DR012670, partial [Diplocarpon rosae]
PTETVLVDRSRSREDSCDRAPLQPRVLPKSRASVGSGNVNNSVMSAIRASISASPKFQSSTETCYVGDPPQLIRADAANKRGKDTLATLSINVVPFECSFTRNPLDPRSRYITCQPLSTTFFVLR